jgi:hypothetical protein
MTPDRALELAESALHERRANAKYRNMRDVEVEAEEALRILSDIRATMLTRHLHRASDGLQEADEGQPTAEASEELRAADNARVQARLIDAGCEDHPWGI